MFWLQCLAGIGSNAYQQLWLRTDIAITEAMLQVITAAGLISLGAAANSLIIVISAEGIMVLASWFKRRQFEQGMEKGRAEERKRTNAKLRAWAEEKGISVDELPIDDKDGPD